jgi:hypothetical protein
MAAFLIYEIINLHETCPFIILLALLVPSTYAELDGLPTISSSLLSWSSDPTLLGLALRRVGHRRSQRDTPFLFLHLSLNLMSHLPTLVTFALIELVLYLAAAVLPRQQILFFTYALCFSLTIVLLVHI